MKILVIKTHRGLVPVYDSDLENYVKIPLNEQFYIEYKKTRNIKFHKKYFALLKLGFENQDKYSSMEDLRRDLIITAGLYTEVVNVITGEVYILANSISFSKMDDMEFDDLYNKTKDVICKWLGLSNEAVEDEILQHF